MESALVIWKIQDLELMESFVVVIPACARTPVAWSALVTGNVIVRATVVRVMKGGKEKIVLAVKSMLFKPYRDILCCFKHELLCRGWEKNMRWKWRMCLW